MIIPGRYWDSHIYSGRLYLFGRDGDITTLNWDGLIEAWDIEKSLRLAMNCAFKQSDFLYGGQFHKLFTDTEVREVVRDKFVRLAEFSLEVSPQRLENAIIKQQDSPFSFLPTDLTIYKNQLYVVSQSGVFRSHCSKKNTNPVSSRTEKEWDGSAFAISASYNTLALAAGGDGLFELPIGNGSWNRTREAKQLTSRDCTGCNWTYYSIYCSSHMDRGYLAAFTKQTETDEEGYFTRIFDGLISSQAIFHARGGYSWGSHDKLYQATDSLIRVVRYEPWKKTPGERLTALGTIDARSSPDTRNIHLAPWKGGIVSGGVALFGTIVECENAVVVIPSEGPVVTLPGEPINWRVFPRSIQYENQLHLIYEDRLEVLSFNQDYLVDQKEKRSGTRFSHWRSPSLHRDLEPPPADDWED